MTAIRSRRLSVLLLCVAAVLAGLAWYALAWRPGLQLTARAGYVHDPPYMFADGAGRPRGIAIDVLQEAARRSGITVEWVRVAIPLNADMALRSGLVDLWPSLTILERRRPDVFFTDPWLQAEVWVVVRDQGDLPSSQFSGKVAVSNLPVTQYLVAEHFPLAEKVVYADGPALVDAICSNQVPVALLSGGDLADAQSSGSHCGDARLRAHAVAGSTLSLGIGARRGFEATAERLRTEIDTMAGDGTLRTLVVRYSVYTTSEVLGVYEVLQARARTRFFAYGAVLLAIALLTTLTLAAAFYRADRRARQSLEAKVAMEAKLHAAQRLELLGQLAGGIAHDFNNLVTIIVGYATLIEPEVAAMPTAAQALQQIRRAGERASNLVRQLLTFSQRQLVEPRVLSLHEQLAEMQPMLGRLVREDIRIELDLRATHDLVSIDSGQFARVLMNLAVNASDAMPAGGILSIATADEKAAGAASAAVHLTVTDTGVGMSPEVQSRAFEPFFTTKAVGRGTGLGLASVHGIVTQAGGEVVLHSAPGEGTCFDLRLPTVDAVASKQEDPVRAPAVSGVILVVDDEADVRSLVSGVLRRAGHTVAEAEDGRDALEHLSVDDGRIVLVVTDLVMPHISGQRLFEHARDLPRRVPFLFMSGYSEGGVPSVGTAGTALLAKPFTPEQLLQAVSDALRGQPPSPGRSAAAADAIAAVLESSAADGRQSSRG